MKHKSKQKGEWDNEPDFLEWYVSDIHCVIIRNKVFGK